MFHGFGDRCNPRWFHLEMMGAPGMVKQVQVVGKDTCGKQLSGKPDEGVRIIVNTF